MHHQFASQTESDFARARLKAFWREVRAMIAHRPNELVSFEQVKRMVMTFGEYYRGVQTVALDHIIGSATLRYHDFDRAFLPTQARTKSRWRRVDEAYYEEVALPPVQLYQVGDVYFVRDGHHRVSVARERGQTFIDAEVIEVKTRVPVTSDLLASDLEIVGEYAHFIDKTRFDQVRPEQNIRFSEPGGYTRLIEHIAVHRYFIGKERNKKIARDEAVASWYDQVYLPVVSAIREHHILKDFPQRTEADLYLWIMDHHYFLRQQNAQVGLVDAAVDFAKQFSQRLDKRLIKAVKHAVMEYLEGETLKPMIATFVSEPHTPDKDAHHE